MAHRDKPHVGLVRTRMVLGVPVMPGSPAFMFEALTDPVIDAIPPSVGVVGA